MSDSHALSRDLGSLSPQEADVILDALRDAGYEADSCDEAVEVYRPDHWNKTALAAYYAAVDKLIAVRAGDSDAAISEMVKAHADLAASRDEWHAEMRRHRANITGRNRRGNSRGWWRQIIEGGR